VHSLALIVAQFFPLHAAAYVGVSRQKMEIRKAEKLDIGDVAKIVRGLSHYYLEGGQKDLPEWFESTLTDKAFTSRFCDKNYFNFVAENDGEIIGYISIKSGFHLYHLFVSSTVHKQGIASRLWQYCVDNLKIEQCTVRSTLFAVPVYTQFGFCVTDSIAYKDGIGFQSMVYNRPSC
jgi:predicted N-acetyltransferase YhbS